MRRPRYGYGTMGTLTTNRREAAIDFGVALGVVLVSLLCIPALTAVFRHLSALAAVLILAAFQFASEGLVPLILMAIRGERFSDYGFNWRNLGKSIALAVCLVAAYDLALSLHAARWIWVPLRRHNALRISFAAGFPLSLVGLVVVIATWGFFEAFFGVFVAKKLNQVLGHVGNGWLAPGVWGFALFNGFLHAAIGQGVAGFLTSFASGYAIAVIPAVTANAWGSSLFQTATNAVGGL
ncbi:MAG: hypothetical protein WBQ56_13865 [Candidatus Sulfotelmatobacter sp.]